MPKNNNARHTYSNNMTTVTNYTEQLIHDIKMDIHVIKSSSTTDEDIVNELQYIHIASQNLQRKVEQLINELRSL